MPRSNKEDRAAEQALLQESEEWETGGRAENSVAASSEEEAAIDAALGLQMISLRLPPAVVEEFKRRAAAQGLKYQPYIRQVLIDHLKRPSVEERLTKLEKAQAG